MPAPLAAIPAIVLAGVLVAAGIGKLRHPDDLAAWAELGIPAPLRQEWLRRIHPWGEIVLGLAVLVLGGILGAAAATAATALMAVYLVVVARAVRSRPGASCACFGERRALGPMTIVRNSWYLVLALVTLATVWTAPLWGGVLVALDTDAWGWLVGAVVVAVTILLTVGTGPADADDEAQAETDPIEEPAAVLDYVPSRTPSVPLAFADGTPVNLRELTMREPTLLLAVKRGCRPCEEVLAQVPQWRALLPEVTVRLLLPHDAEGDQFAERDEPQSLHDPHGYVRGSIDDWVTPAAVLFGGNGMVAGGPEIGVRAIERFVADIDENLHGGPTS